MINACFLAPYFGRLQRNRNWGLLFGLFVRLKWLQYDTLKKTKESWGFFLFLFFPLPLACTKCVASLVVNTLFSHMRQTKSICCVFLISKLTLYTHALTEAILAIGNPCRQMWSVCQRPAEWMGKCASVLGTIRWAALMCVCVCVRGRSVKQQRDCVILWHACGKIQGSLWQWLN